MGIVTASATFFRTLGSAVGLAIYGAVLTASLKSELAQRLPDQADAPTTLVHEPSKIQALPEATRVAVQGSITYRATSGTQPGPNRAKRTGEARQIGGLGTNQPRLGYQNPRVGFGNPASVSPASGFGLRRYQPTVGLSGWSATMFLASRSANSLAVKPSRPCRISRLCSPKSGEWRRGAGLASTKRHDTPA